MKSEEIAYIIISFVLIATFISVFFFTYVSSVEGDIIKTQISKVMGDFVNSTDLFLTLDQKRQVGKIITDGLTMPDMSQTDREAEDNNNKLIKKSLMIFGIIIGIGLVIVLGMWYIYKFNFVEMLTYSLMILGLVAITEFLFVTFIIKNYRLIDENYLSYLVIDNLQKYASS